jgi:hypothetical protein
MTTYPRTHRSSPPQAQPGGPRAQSAQGAEVSPDRIRARAYDIFRRRSGGPGDAVADWLQAERELKGGPRRGKEGAPVSATPRGEVLLRDAD